MPGHHCTRRRHQGKRHLQRQSSWAPSPQVQRLSPRPTSGSKDSAAHPPTHATGSRRYVTVTITRVRKARNISQGQTLLISQPADDAHVAAAHRQMSSTAAGHCAGPANVSRSSSRAKSEACADRAGATGYDDNQPTSHAQAGPGAAIQPAKLALAAGGPSVRGGLASSTGAQRDGTPTLRARLATPITIDTDDEDTPERKRPLSFAKTIMTSQIYLPGGVTPLKPIVLPLRRPSSVASDLSFNLSDSTTSGATQNNAGAQLTAAQAMEMQLALDRYAKQTATHSSAEAAVSSTQQALAPRVTGKRGTMKRLLLFVMSEAYWRRDLLPEHVSNSIQQIKMMNRRTQTMMERLDQQPRKRRCLMVRWRRSKAHGSALR